MNNYDYNLNKADECIKLVNDIVYEYDKVYSQLNNSFNDIIEIWSGETAEKYLKKYEDLLADMHTTDSELNELKRLTLEKKEISMEWKIMP